MSKSAPLAKRVGVLAALLLAAGSNLGPAAAQQPDRNALAGYSARTSYVLRCSGCHGLSGEGSIKGGIPQLRDLAGAFAGDDDGRTYLVKVPGVRNAQLTPEQTAAVLNYVMAAFAGPSLPPDAAPFTAEEIRRRLASADGDVVALRRAVVARMKAEGIAVADYPWP